MEVFYAIYFISIVICLLSIAFKPPRGFGNVIFNLFLSLWPGANTIGALIVISDFFKISDLIKRPFNERKFHEDVAKIREFINNNQAVSANNTFRGLHIPSGNLQGEYLNIKNEVDKSIARLEHANRVEIIKISERVRRIEEEEKKQREIKNQDLRRQQEEKEKERRQRIALLAQSGQILDSLSPQEFELIILEAFSRQGYEVTHTAFTGDEGVDGFLEKGSMKIAIQCKKHSGSIGQPAIRDFYGAMMHFKCEKGFFLITSDFSDPAREFVENKKIKLFDRQQTLDLLQSTLNNDYVLNGKKIKFPYPFNNKESILSALKSQNTNDKTSSQGLSSTGNLSPFNEEDSLLSRLLKEAQNTNAKISHQGLPSTGNLNPFNKKESLLSTQLKEFQNANDKTSQQGLSSTGNLNKSEADQSKQPLYRCYKCGKEVWILARVVEYLDKTYCRDCSPRF